MKKRLFAILLTVTLIMALVACGGEGKDGVGSSGKNDSGSIAGPTAEEDIVILIGDVEIPLTATWEEFADICEENNWEIEEDLYPDTSGWDSTPYEQNGSVITPDGELLVKTMANETNDGSVLMSIAISPFYYEGEASVMGVSPETKQSEIEDHYELIEHDSEHYYYEVDEYVTLKISPDTYEGKNTVTIVREQYTKR